MKALSIRQPWASLIVDCGKDIENRTWSTNYRGPVLIHAGKAHDQDDYESAYNFTRGHPVTLPIEWMMSDEGSDRNHIDWMDDELPRGGIIGIAEITDCVSQSDSPWFMGPYGFVLRNARPLDFFACPGKLSFFEVDYPHKL